nr:MAG TPA: hypothetical protein [Caudoviricetes sp.]
MSEYYNFPAPKIVRKFRQRAYSQNIKTLINLLTSRLLSVVYFRYSKEKE